MCVCASVQMDSAWKDERININFTRVFHHPLYLVPRIFGRFPFLSLRVADVFGLLSSSSSFVEIVLVVVVVCGASHFNGIHKLYGLINN